MAKKRFCSIPGCGNPHMSRGWCTKHWYRWRRHGSPTAGRTFEGEPLAFLNETVLPFDGDECLEWPFSNNSGYGQILLDGSLKTVPRIVCEKVHGPAPTAHHQAAHSCGKGHEGCCNPRHLRWATPAENTADKAIHGTQNRGENHPHNRLSAEDVLAIRALKGSVPMAEIGARFGVNASTVHRIQHRHIWTWL